MLSRKDLREWVIKKPGNAEVERKRKEKKKRTSLVVRKIGFWLDNDEVILFRDFENLTVLIL